MKFKKNKPFGLYKINLLVIINKRKKSHNYHVIRGRTRTLIDKIDNNNVLNTQNALQESQATQGISGHPQKNALLNKSLLVDESNISQAAVALYKHEQEISQYTKYLDNVSMEDANKQVMSLMEKGIISVSDEELADKMFQNLGLLNELFN